MDSAIRWQQQQQQKQHRVMMRQRRHKDDVYDARQLRQTNSSTSSSTTTLLDEKDLYIQSCQDALLLPQSTTSTTTTTTQDDEDNENAISQISFTAFVSDYCRRHNNNNTSPSKSTGTVMVVRGDACHDTLVLFQDLPIALQLQFVKYSTNATTTTLSSNCYTTDSLLLQHNNNTTTTTNNNNTCLLDELNASGKLFYVNVTTVPILCSTTFELMLSTGLLVQQHVAGGSTITAAPAMSTPPTLPVPSPPTMSTSLSHQTNNDVVSTNIVLWVGIGMTCIFVVGLIIGKCIGCTRLLRTLGGAKEKKKRLNNNNHNNSTTGERPSRRAPPPLDDSDDDDDDDDDEQRSYQHSSVASDIPQHEALTLCKGSSSPLHNNHNHHHRSSSILETLTQWSQNTKLRGRSNSEQWRTRRPETSSPRDYSDGSDASATFKLTSTHRHYPRRFSHPSPIVTTTTLPQQLQQLSDTNPVHVRKRFSPRVPSPPPAPRHNNSSSSGHFSFHNYDDDIDNDTNDNSPSPWTHDDPNDADDQRIGDLRHNKVLLVSVSSNKENSTNQSEFVGSTAGGVVMSSAADDSVLGTTALHNNSDHDLNRQPRPALVDRAMAGN